MSEGKKAGKEEEAKNSGIRPEYNIKFFRTLTQDEMRKNFNWKERAIEKGKDNWEPIPWEEDENGEWICYFNRAKMFEYLTMFYFLNKIHIERNPLQRYNNDNVDQFLKSIIIRSTKPKKKEMRPRNLPFFEKTYQTFGYKDPNAPFDFDVTTLSDVTHPQARESKASTEYDLDRFLLRDEEQKNILITDMFEDFFDDGDQPGNLLGIDCKIAKRTADKGFENIDFADAMAFFKKIYEILSNNRDLFYFQMIGLHQGGKIYKILFKKMNNTNFGSFTTDMLKIISKNLFFCLICHKIPMEINNLIAVNKLRAKEGKQPIELTVESITEEVVHQIRRGSGKYESSCKKLIRATGVDIDEAIVQFKKNINDILPEEDLDVSFFPHDFDNKQKRVDIMRNVIRNNLVIPRPEDYENFKNRNEENNFWGNIQYHFKSIIEETIPDDFKGILSIGVKLSGFRTQRPPQVSLTFTSDVSPLQYNPDNEIFEKDDNNEYLFIKFNENQEKTIENVDEVNESVLIRYGNDERFKQNLLFAISKKLGTELKGRSAIKTISRGLDEILIKGGIYSFKVLFDYVNESIKRKRNISPIPPNNYNMVRFLNRIKSIFQNNILRYPQNRNREKYESIISHIDQMIISLRTRHNNSEPQLRYGQEQERASRKEGEKELSATMGGSKNNSRYETYETKYLKLVEIILDLLIILNSLKQIIIDYGDRKDSGYYIFDWIQDFSLYIKTNIEFTLRLLETHDQYKYKFEFSEWTNELPIENNDIDIQVYFYDVLNELKKRNNYVIGKLNNEIKYFDTTNQEQKVSDRNLRGGIKKNKRKRTRKKRKRRKKKKSKKPKKQRKKRTRKKRRKKKKSRRKRRK